MFGSLAGGCFKALHKGDSGMSTYVSHGSMHNIDELKVMLANGDPDWWTLNPNARPGDRVIFYIHSPISAFVAIGEVASKPKYDDGRMGWEGKHGGKVIVQSMIDPYLTRLEALKLLPDWGWLKSPQAAARVPDAIEPKLLRRVGDTTRVAKELAPPSKGGGFGQSPEDIREVEVKAVEVVWNHFASDGWQIVDRQDDNCGYDLECSRGKKKMHVEVKGTSGGNFSFIITDNELRSAKIDRKFHLCLVTGVRSKEPSIYMWNGRQLLDVFDVRALSYMATLREGGAE